MSGVGGPGGIGGPKGPGGPGPVDDVPDVADVGEVSATGSASPVDALVAELAAGKLTAHEAIEKLVDQIANTEHLSAADQADLRELLTDLVTNDPHLAALANRL